MNTERIIQLADFIAQLPPEQFDMTEWLASPRKSDTNEQVRHDCNTVGCIGGWAEALFNPAGDPYDTGDTATTLLGLTADQSCDLFTPPGYSNPARWFTQEAAVATLRRLAETGEVKWHTSE